MHSCRVTYLTLKNQLVYRFQCSQLVQWAITFKLLQPTSININQQGIYIFIIQNRAIQLRNYVLLNYFTSSFPAYNQISYNDMVRRELNVHVFNNDVCVFQTFAFLSMVMFIPIFIITLLSGIRKIQEASNTRSNEVSAQPPPYYHLHN